jgi:hypothetical protein
MTRLRSLQDRAAVARAIEENAAKLLLTMGRAGGGEEYHDAHIRWTIGGSPIDYHNAVVHADLAPETADAAIQAVVAKLREHGVPGSWRLTEAMTCQRGWRRRASKMAVMSRAWQSICTR